MIRAVGTPFRPHSSRARSAAFLALAGSTLFACDETAPGRTDPATGVERVVLTPGALRGRYPPRPDDVAGGTYIEGAFGLAVGNGSAYVLDQTASRVLAIDADARVTARFGAPGSGPGELAKPFSLAVGPDGDVWVGDPGAGRLSRYGPDGTHVDDYRMPYPVVNFAVLARGPVFPSLDASTLLAASDSAGGSADLPVPDGVVPRRISRGPEDRVAPHILRLARLPGGDVALLQNRHGTRFALWRARLEEGGGRIDAVEALPLPGWLATMLREETERIRAGTSEEFATGDFLIPFKGMHVDGGRLWLAPAPSGRALAVAVPLTPAEPEIVVVAEDDVVRGAIDAAVLDGRLVVLYRTEVRVYELDRAPARRFRPSEGGD